MQTENRHRSIVRKLTRVFARLLRTTGLLILVAVFVVLVVSAYYAWRASAFDLTRISQTGLSGRVYDCNMQSIGNIYQRESCAYLPGEQIPRQLKHALLAREDQDFYSHAGVDASSLLRAMYRNVRTQHYAQGASTLTMQLVRNVYLSRDKNLDRKLEEIALALRVERNFTKDQILELYLNRVYFGEGCYGVADAGEFYFAKKPQELSLSECACLIGLLRRPSYFNPVASMQTALQQRDEVLDRMLECGYINSEQNKQAKQQPLQLAKREFSPNSYVMSQLHRELDPLLEQEQIQDAGLQIISGVDLEMQKKLETYLERSLLDLENSEQWSGTTRQKNPAGALQAVVLVSEPSSGRVLCMVAGRDPMDGKDRWRSQDKMPGTLFAPLVFVAVSQNSKNIIPGRVSESAGLIGTGPILELCKQLGWQDLPGDLEKLSQGLFPRSLGDIVRMLHIISSAGSELRLHGISKIADANNRLIYEKQHQAEQVLARDGCLVAAKSWPFKSSGRSASLLCELPQNHGWVAYSADPKYAVFVWLGFDDPANLANLSKANRKALQALILQWQQQLPQCLR